MSLTSLVNNVLTEGDEIWVEKDGERIEEVYESHVIENGYPRVRAKSGKTYMINDGFSGATDFGLAGENSFYSVLEDYGLDGEKVPERVAQAVETAKKVDYSGQKQEEVAVAD